MLKVKVELRDSGGFEEQYEAVRKAIDANCNEIATNVLSNAKSTAAFVDKTGNLRAAIKKKKSKFEDGGYIVEAGGRGVSKGYHASNVEFGHAMIAWGKIMVGRRVPPHPFLRPALEKEINNAIALFTGAK